jgi:hypothetical protein
MRCYTAFIALFLFSAPIATTALFGQQSDDSIVLGGDRFRLGMPKDQVLKLLTSYFDVQGTPGGRNTPCDSSCSVIEPGGPPYKFVASVSFKDGRLSSVIRHWSPDDQQAAVPYARALWGAISSLVKDGKTVCTIAAGQNESSRGAFITCGDRQIHVSIDRVHLSPDPNSKIEEVADIDEHLEKK